MAVFCQAGKKSGLNSQAALRRGFTVISITSVLKYNYSIQASIIHIIPKFIRPFFHKVVHWPVVKRRSEL